jgi:predicted dehydrogenase
MRALNTAILGFGNVAERGHLPAWKKRDDFAVVAVSDPDAGRRAVAAAVLPAARRYASAEQLLASEKIDVVDIAAPPYCHGPLIVAAARAGAHILCEKPLATSWKDYRTAVDAVREAGVVLFTVHNWKHSAQFLRVAALIAEGAIGRVEHVRLETIRNGQAASVGPSWRASAELGGGGILVDHGWHALYLLLELCRERPRRIAAHLERRRSASSDVEDTATIELEFASATADVHLTWAGDERRTRWELRGTGGALVLEDGRLRLERGGEIFRDAFPYSLSASSHHPEWFGAVVDELRREIADPTVRGENLVEAELCLVLTRLAYESNARGGSPLAVPAPAAA